MFVRMDMELSMAIGLSRRTLNKRIGEEQKAQSDYGKNLAEVKRKKDTKSAKVIGHIRGEEREHESMLRKLGA
jgi:rubrerythrin